MTTPLANEWPRIIDFEASGLGPMSYPIEIAWSQRDGSIEEHLINPDTAPRSEDWTGRNWNSCAIHGLAREYLFAFFAEGHSPTEFVPLLAGK